MAKSTPLNRKKLEKLFGNDHEAITAFERLVSDVSTALPDAIGDSDIVSALAAGDAASGRATAGAALRQSDELSAMYQTMRGMSARIEALSQQVETLRTELMLSRRPVMHANDDALFLAIGVR